MKFTGKTESGATWQIIGRGPQTVAYYVGTDDQATLVAEIEYGDTAVTTVLAESDDAALEAEMEFWCVMAAKGLSSNAAPLLRATAPLFPEAAARGVIQTAEALEASADPLPELPAAARAYVDQRIIELAKALSASWRKQRPRR